MYLVGAARFAKLRDAWVEAAESTIKCRASQPLNRPDITFLAVDDNQTTLVWSSYLTCFAGENFLLGGQALGRSDHPQSGLRLLLGCHESITH